MNTSLKCMYFRFLFWKYINKEKLYMEQDLVGFLPVEYFSEFTEYASATLNKGTNK